MAVIIVKQFSNNQDTTDVQTNDDRPDRDSSLQDDSSQVLDNEDMETEDVPGLCFENAVVRIHAEPLSGSGVIILATSEYIDICTSKHLVESSYESEVTFTDGAIAKAQSFYYSLEHDLAFIRVSKDLNPDFDFSNRTGIAFALDAQLNEYSVGDVIGVIASHTGAGKDQIKGILTDKNYFASDFNEWVMMIECEVKNGYSGGGVFSQDNFFVGMIVGSDGTYGICIPSTIIAEEYDKACTEI